MNDKTIRRVRPSATEEAAPSTPHVPLPSSVALQGEGDYESARRYNAEQQKFVAEHDMNALADAAAPSSEEEAASMARAEERGRERSKGDSPGDQVPRRRGRFLRRKR
jgi:hypothetical protein